MSISDSFNRADGGLGANWTVLEGTMAVASNAAMGSVICQYNSAYWSANAWNADQTSQLTKSDGGFYTAPAIRMQSGPSYYAWTNNGNFFKHINGSDTQIGSPSPATSAGDIQKIGAVGTTITCYLNGASVASATDAALSSGAAGLACYGVPSMDDFLATGEVTTGVTRKFLLVRR